MAQGFVTHSGDGLATASECLVELMVVLLEGTVTQLSRTPNYSIVVFIFLCLLFKNYLSFLFFF